MLQPPEGLRVVFVRAYVRWRLHRWEHVCAHWRRWPGQYELPL